MEDDSYLDKSSEYIGTNFLKAVFSRKNLIIGVIFFLLLFLPLFFIMFLGNKKSPENIVTTPTITADQKTWEIVVTYDRKQDELGLNELKLLNRKITQDYRSAKFSEYELFQKDGLGRVLFRSKVNITEQIIYDIDFESTDSASVAYPPTPNILETVLYVPFFETGKTIIITRDGVLMLEFVLSTSKNSFFKIDPVEEAYAQVCTPLIAVFVSDNYSDFSQFRKDVETFRQAFLSMEPYNSIPNMFDFKILENSEDLGCKFNFGCIVNQRRIMNIVTSNYPNFSKVAIIVNRNHGPDINGALGVTNAIGGNISSFSNNLGNITQGVIKTALHEFLGHEVGLLYDRYVGGSGLQKGIRSNCTDNPNGEEFWNNIGVTKTFPGCSTSSLYAPAELDCGRRGNSKTAMSAGSCGRLEFDAVEKAWISQIILPDYASCTVGILPPILTSTPTLSPTPTLTPTPTGVLPKTPTLSPTPTLTPIPTSASGGSAPKPTVTPTPTPIPYNCYQDPNCNPEGSALKICPLICNPK